MTEGEVTSITAWLPCTTSAPHCIAQRGVCMCAACLYVRHCSLFRYVAVGQCLLHGVRRPRRRVTALTAFCCTRARRGYMAITALVMQPWRELESDSEPAANVQIDFGMVEENAGNNALHLRRISKGETIHIPQGAQKGIAVCHVMFHLRICWSGSRLLSGVTVNFTGQRPA